MKPDFSSFLRSNYRTAFTVSILIIIFHFSVDQNYLLFHTIVELFSIVIAFAVFIVTWNSRRMLDNNYLYFIGVAYLFVGGLDLLHTITFPGMQIIPGHEYYANQFWVATRFLQAITLSIGFVSLKRKKILNGDLTILAFCFLATIIILSILKWHIFPVCFVEGEGQTSFKIYAEYAIIFLVLLACVLLFVAKHHFDKPVFRLLFASFVFTIVGEFCFTLYISNYSFTNALGHYAKLISFFLIYKAIVETGFSKPTQLIFKNLKDNEKKYRTLAENLPELIVRFDQDFKCLYANTAIEKFLPHNHNFYTGKRLQELGFPAAFERQLLQLLTEVKATQISKVLNFELNEETNSYSFSVNAIPEYGSDKTGDTFLVICYDITELKMKEQSLQDLNATKDKFFSIIAHDLRNPFTSLIAFSELIHKSANKLSTEKIEVLALRMYDSAKQAFTLLENLLNWSRVQTGALVPNPQELDVSGLLEEIRELSNSLALAKGIEVNIESCEAGKVMADRQMIHTVLRNLIANAIKFSYANGTIVLAAVPKNGSVLFSVKDSGIGIEKENLHMLLQSESKITTSGTQNEKGTGLGLILCKEFVELSGGEIWVESEFGFGATFWFTIPSVPAK